MKTSCIAAVLGAILLWSIGGSRQAAAEQPTPPNRWWPAQVMPKGIVSVKIPKQGSAPWASYEMAMQSVAGLAAKAVNEGRSDELAWVETADVSQNAWLAGLRRRRPQLDMRDAFDLWEMVDRCKRRGIIKGYILYRADHSKGEINEHRPEIDCSVNVATSLAGILDGVIVEEGIEGEAKAHGLSLLMDARDKTQAWCFETYRDRFNRRMACMQDPRKPHVRDLAIAQKAFTGYGDEEPLPALLKWLDPLSPILGWNGGDEFKTTEMSSAQGHIQTATDWCMNLPVLMAGAGELEQAKVKDFDPRAIDWKDTRSAVSFVSTDGDNVQFFESNFFQGGESASYWSSPERGAIPFGWSCCFTHLAQLCPAAVDYAANTKSADDGFIEWGGGYYYPDLFGSSRADRWELLAEQARRTLALMRRSNTRIVGYNMRRFDSPDARKAYEVIAAQADDLQGILAFQYDPYEAGAGQVFWVKDKNGVEIPVVTARYSIWEHANGRERAGTPAKIAREIRDAVGAAGGQPRFDWVIVHAWSWFKRSPGVDEDAENTPQNTAAAQGGRRGYAPAVWCAERLPPSIRTISPAEMVWRLRMEHDPAQTQKAIEQWRP